MLAFSAFRTLTPLGPVVPRAPTRDSSRSSPPSFVSFGPHRPTLRGEMTALSGTDTTPIASITDLVAYFEGGAKPVSEWRVGIEQEKIAVTLQGRPAPFAGPSGIEE